MNLKRLKTLITGGSQGLGKAIARQFVLEGADVMICARGERELFAARDSILCDAQPGQQVLAQVCDVSSESQVKELMAETLKALGGLDAMVLNAGIYGPIGPAESLDLEMWRRAIDINLFGVLLPCREAIPVFKKAGRGKIIILSGGGATNPLPNLSAYAASKAAVVRLMETLAGELKQWNVDVNAIAPGPLQTRLIDEVLAAGPECAGPEFYEMNKRWKEDGATPLETGAALAVYLAGARSDGISGKLISAVWDDWERLHEHRDALSESDVYCLRRIVPGDRGHTWR